MLRALVLACVPVAAIAGPVFTPVEVPVSIYDGGWEHFVGGGVSAFDCNGDRFPELFASGGSNPAKLLLNETGAPGADVMRHRGCRAGAGAHVRVLCVPSVRVFHWGWPPAQNPPRSTRP